MQAQGLYDPRHEHGSCGVGFLANVSGEASHTLVTRGIELLRNLLHRGATGADLSTGDGAGILLQVPDDFLRGEFRNRGVHLPPAGRYGTLMAFLPRAAAAQAQARQRIERECVRGGMEWLGWRDVPTQEACLGEGARNSCPHVAQACVAAAGLEGDALERRLYVLRRRIEKVEPGAYVCSFSSRRVVYKGLMTGVEIPEFYGDLTDERVRTAAAVVHQRYSTNTFPSWELAQPFRFLAHNGEINTLRGNRNAMRSREGRMRSSVLGPELADVLPVLDADASDSACLDSALELLVMAGRSIEHAMLMLAPPAWGVKYPMGPDLRGCLEYHAGLMEPWDGPAAVAFLDGRFVGAMLDRNGLRPARYAITRDGFVVFASEAGVLDLPAETVERRGSLRPGEILLVDLQEHRVLYDTEIKMHLARRQPYRRWVEENKIEVHGFFNAVGPVHPQRETLLLRQRLFGYTREDLRVLLDPMAATGHEPIGSMGADQPLAVLSERPQLLYGYFKQLFAQVTNPPIDPIREELVMSLMTFMGTTEQILSEGPQHARLVKLRHPILSNEDLARIRGLDQPDFLCKTLSIGFAAASGGAGLERALEELCAKAQAALRGGSRFVVLSDRDLPPEEAPIPALLAVSSVNTHLIRSGRRTSASLLVETGEAREVMHMAALLGFGASAINPYLAFESIADRVERGELSVAGGVTQAIENYIQALCRGLLKIMSKMGVSTLRSYRSAQVFEALGLDRSVADRYFEGVNSRIRGVGLEEIAAEAGFRYAESRRQDPETPTLLPGGGRYAYRADGERHLWTPESIHLLQRAARENDPDLYRRYAERINDQARSQCTLRGLLRLRAVQAPVAVGEVEPAAAIMQRFVTGAMSFGSISREAHETLARAMNRIGGMSNSGEGGEDPARFVRRSEGDSLCSAVKQVASGRFGVTAEYLASARELQIKIAQGAKPGEGGQLPGHKVDREIARVRHSMPGVTLISPPPHHDIYSIEDIAQLIHDLKCANPAARISVKLVSEMGVGTVAAGVAKGCADMVLISGYDGGTGASPLSSIQHAGTPWEIGLSEVQQTLQLNGLRDRIRVQVDGQLKTGRDVVIGALMGAEEFGFATAALVVCGCVMMRKCHRNTCPVGVATQDPRLRRRFAGRPEHVVNFFRFLAEEVREHMAELGFRTFDEMVGRTECLRMDESAGTWKARKVDFSDVLWRPSGAGIARRCHKAQDHALERCLDMRLMDRLAPAFEKGVPVSVRAPVRNVDRSVGTMIAGRVAARYGARGLPDDTLALEFEGSAGQSFGAFACSGMTLTLVGEANDYVGKGLSGARIIVKPFAGTVYDAGENVIAGNVLLYGATSGELFVNGRAGERFAVRNSGARAVVEGIGDHGCEYMTGGCVVVLGPTGVNFGAGMSGGKAWVYDETALFDSRCNLEMIDLERVRGGEDERELKDLIERHARLTGSRRAIGILARWKECLPRFVKVFPMEYRRALGQMSREDVATERSEVLDS